MNEAFDHASPADRTFEREAVAARNARVGMRLFLVYLAFYAGFVLLNAFRPEVMDTVVAGVNLAIWYGFALIGAALALALVYAWVCRTPAGEARNDTGIREGRP